MIASSEREIHEFQRLLNARDPRALHVYSEYQRTNNEAYFHAAVRSIVASLPTSQTSIESQGQIGQVSSLDQSIPPTSGGDGDLPMNQPMYLPHHQVQQGYDLNMMNSQFQGLGMGKQSIN